MVEAGDEQASYHAGSENHQGRRNDSPDFHQVSLIELSGAQTVCSSSAAKPASDGFNCPATTVQTVIASIMATQGAAARQSNRAHNDHGSVIGAASAAMTRFSKA